MCPGLRTCTGCCKHLDKNANASYKQSRAETKNRRYAAAFASAVMTWNQGRERDREKKREREREEGKAGHLPALMDSSVSERTGVFVKHVKTVYTE